MDEVTERRRGMQWYSDKLARLSESLTYWFGAAAGALGILITGAFRGGEYGETIRQGSMPLMFAAIGVMIYLGIRIAQVRLARRREAERLMIHDTLGI